MKFTDKRGRNICLQERDDTIYANCEDKEDDLSEEDISFEGNNSFVGYIQFLINEYPQGNGNDIRVAYPEQMHIKENYRRSGIATKIMKYAKEVFDEVLFMPDTGCGGNTDEIHYTSEGLAFKEFCEKSGITRYSSDYDDEDY